MTKYFSHSFPFPNKKSRFLPVMVFLFCLIVPFSDAIGQKKILNFNHLTSKEGLSQNHGLCVLQDSKGFMWFGTEGGLNKYDGYNFTIYKTHAEDSLSISGDLVYDILEDSEKNIWVATNSGLNLYNRKKDNFFRFKNDPQDINTISDNVVEVLFEDKDKILWIGARNGLNKYDGATKQISRIPSENITGRIYALHEDKQGNMWVGAANGLFLLDRITEVFTQYGKQQVSALLEGEDGKLFVGLRYNGLQIYDLDIRKAVQHFNHNPEDVKSIGNNVVFKLYKDRNKNIWVGTENGGLNLYNPEKNNFTRYQHNSFDSKSLSNNTVSAIYEDNSGILWVGVHRGGINYYDPQLERFQIYQKQAVKSSVSNNNITGFAEDSKGNLWIGTDGGGLNFWNRKEDTFTHYTHLEGNKNSLSNDVVVYVYIDKEDNVWASTYQGGLNKFNPKKKEFTQYQHDPSDPKSIGNNFVWCVDEDSQGNLWCSTRGSGISILDKKSNSFTSLKVEEGNDKSLLSNYVNCFLEDSKGNFWVGTNMGLNILDRNTKEVVAKFQNNVKDSTSISDGDITVVFEDHKNRIWVGTRNGLNLYNPETNAFKVFRQKDGLPNSYIASIQEDSEGNLWLGTQKGLSKFNFESNSIETYTAFDGLQGDEFSMNASIRMRNGELIFGGIEGFSAFYPEKIKDNEFIPPVSITDFMIFNKRINPAENTFLNEHVGETEAITLSYKESVFSFEFAAQNYTFPEKNQYAYMMEGFDKDWNYMGNMRTASYTNLDPGSYTFRVKASNNDGVWNEKGTSLAIVITPPYWKTWWFRTLLALSVMGGALTFYKVRMNAIKAQKEELEVQVKERTAEVVAQKEELESQAENLLVANKGLQESQKEILLHREQIEAQHAILEITNEKVMDSITYAKSIQKAILPSADKISKAFSEHFILYRPKDIVSGDFYWYSHISAAATNGKSAVDLDFIAVIDCTGHGVPGAFMSIIGSNLLHEIVNLRNILDPAQILEELDKGVMRSVEKTEGVNTAGMDVCLIKLEKSGEHQLKVSYSGAKRPLFMVKEGSTELEILEADRRSIGTEKFDNPFTTQNILLDKGTSLYLITDGYIDQNDPERNKIGTPRFKKCILDVVKHPMEEQLSIFEQVLDEHQKDAEQRDDITLIGLRI